MQWACKNPSEKSPVWGSNHSIFMWQAPPPGSGLKMVGKQSTSTGALSFLVAPGTLGMMGLSEARLEVERASVQAKQGCRGGMDRPSAGFLTRAGEEWGGSNLNAARQGSQESFLQNQVSGWVKPAVESMHYSERGELYYASNLSLFVSEETLLQRNFSISMNASASNNNTMRWSPSLNAFHFTKWCLMMPPYFSILNGSSWTVTSSFLGKKNLLSLVAQMVLLMAICVAFLVISAYADSHFRFP